MRRPQEQSQSQARPELRPELRPGPRSGASAPAGSAGRRGRTVAFLGLATLMAGCTSINDQIAAVDIPTRAGWSPSIEEPAGAEPVTENWLDALNDPVLAGLIAEAIVYNPNLAAARARVEGARAAARIQRAALLPTAGVGLTSTRVSVPPRSGGADLTAISSLLNPEVLGEIDLDDFLNSQDRRTFETAGVGFTLQWEIDVWGRLTDRTRAAFLNARSAAIDTEAGRLSLAGTVAQTWYALIEARLQRELAESDIETGKASLRIIERRFENGLAAALDVRLARAQLSASEAQAAARRQAEAQIARQLEVLLGRYPGAELQAANALPPPEGPLLEADRRVGLGSPVTLLVRRPDVVAAEARLASAGLEVRAARKAFLPSLTLAGTFTDNRDGLTEFAFDPDQVLSRMSAGLIQPLFAGGALKGQLGARRAEMEAALADYVQTVLNAYLEVENAIDAEARLADRATALAQGAEEAGAAEELTTRQYVQGTVTVFNLIDARQRRLDARAALIAANRERLANRIDLYLALGAPLTVPEPLLLAAAERGPVPTISPAPDEDRPWWRIR